MSQVDLLISIDDTDNLESEGSGTVAENMARAIQGAGLARCTEISRHQLLVHEDIPYTSGNSAMCFSARTQVKNLNELIHFAQAFLREESADGADPGLCVAVNDARLDKDALIAFGREAKKTIVSKQTAYALAGNLPIHLSEHGGNGGGVIGALAAIGLRLFGSDGRFRGWHRLGKGGDITTAADLCAYPFIDAVVTPAGHRLEDDTPIIFAEDPIKTVLLGGSQVVPVVPIAGIDLGLQWSTLSKRQIKQF